MKKYTSSSTVRPPEWDTKSSPHVVYHNYNVAMDPATKDIPSLYKYDVEEYTREEYTALWREESAKRMSESDVALVELAGILSDMMMGVAELAALMAGGE